VRPVGEPPFAELGADDHPFVSALREEVHPNEFAPAVRSASAAPFGGIALNHGDVAQHRHAHGSDCKALKFGLTGFQVRTGRPMIINGGRSLVLTPGRAVPDGQCGELSCRPGSVSSITWCRR